MLDKLNRMSAVKMFFEKDSRKVEMKEMGDFWKSLNEEEKQEFSQSAAKQLGVELVGS